MTIPRTHAAPLAAALCLVLAAPAANAAGFMYYKDSAIVGELPPAPPPLATPTQPGAADGDIDGRDFQIWQRNYGGTAKAQRPRSVRRFQEQGQVKTR